MWTWKHNQRKQAQESNEGPYYMNAEESRRTTALSYALGSLPGASVSQYVEAAKEYLKFLNGGE